MRNTRWISGAGAALGMLILILDGKTAISGATEGLQICMRSVVPALFPFFVLSGVMTSSLSGMGFPFRIPIVPQGAESLLITGFLGGYPVGAQSIAQAYRSGQLTHDQAERMLGFCNHAGPSFLFGMLAPLFPSMKYCWMLWGIHIFSGLIAGILLSGDPGTAYIRPGKPMTLSDAVQQAIKVMASVCGWIILFRIVIAFLDRWIFWILDIRVKTLIIGLLELSNGCLECSSITDVTQRFVACSAFLAVGGLCITMQTVSVTRGLGLRYYFPGKAIQASVSVLLSWAILPKQNLPLWVPSLALMIGLFSVGILRKMQKCSSNPQPIGV